MDVNYQNLVPLSEILADVMVIMNDEDNNKLTPGFYRSQAKYALDELGFDVSFIELHEDYPMPDDLMLMMPKGCFNLKQVQIYNGTPEDIGYVETVYWKKTFKSRGKDMGYTATQMGFNITDPFCRVHTSSNSKYYFSIQNGIIRLSDMCQYYPYARLTFDGIPSKNLDEVRMVPPECRKAITLWATAKCAGAWKIRDNKYRIVELDAQRELDEYGLNGAWHEAKMRLRKMDKKLLSDIILYNAKLNY